MSTENGNGEANAEGMNRILSLSAAKNAPKHALTRAQRAEVERIAYDMVIQECAKVHEHYLTQLPHFTARMIQDALLTYGLIVPQPGADIVPEATVVAPVTGDGSPETRGSIATPPDAHDSIAPAGPAA